jgi:hypothetical protein
MWQKSLLVASVIGICAAGAVACGAPQEPTGGSETEPAKNAPPGNGGGGSTASKAPTPITWCTTGLTRSGTVAGTSLEYPSTPDTTWFNRSLEEVVLNEIDRAMMEEDGLDPDDDEDVRRFRYFINGFDLRWIVRETPAPGNWFGKTDFAVYVFDLVRASAAPDGTFAVFDASAVREARLSGDKEQLGKTIRATVDAMKADPRPKAIIAFAPDRNPESSFERAFINLFARDVHFATTGSVTVSNLRDSSGAPITAVPYPLRNVRTLDVSASGDMAGSAIKVGGSCLDLVISG